MSVAVSRTPDPTGEYYLYCFEIADALPDYPKFGVWPDAYYMSTNDDIPQVGVRMPSIGPKCSPDRPQPIRSSQWTAIL